MKRAAGYLALVCNIGATFAFLGTCPGRAQGVSDQQIAFIARLVQAESGGNQRDRTGAVLVSNAGARGLFQLMPGTAAHLGVNPDTAEGNVRGGLTEIVRLWNKYHGNLRYISAAYNCGDQCLDDWLAGRRSLPAETVRYVNAVANGYDTASESRASQKEVEARKPPDDTEGDDPNLTETYEGK